MWVVPPSPSNALVGGGAWQSIRSHWNADRRTYLLLLALHSLLFLPIDFLCERPVVGTIGIWGERGQRHKRGAKEEGEELKSRLLCALLWSQKLCPSILGLVSLDQAAPSRDHPGAERDDAQRTRTGPGSLCISSSLPKTKDLLLLKYNHDFWE